jgi:hypothetical protein
MMSPSRGVLLDFSLQDLHTFLESLTKFLGRLMNRHRVRSERHLDVEMTAVDPHAIPQP